MFGSRRPRLESLTASEAAERHAAGEIVLVDVREGAEWARGHIEGAVLFPLSTFDASKLPEGALVFYCAVGRRSAVAAESARKAGANVAGHIGDGLTGWIGAGLPLVTG